eukprot:jgi/Hompol1/6276/HPOL_002520-RA
MEKRKTHKERLIVERRVAGLLDEMGLKSRRLLEQYKDEDRLRKVKDYYRRVPNEAARPADLSALIKAPEVELQEIETAFTGEEGLGRYLDLHTQFNQYLNLIHIKKTAGYLAYLSEFDNFRAIPAETKQTSAYREYLESIRTYFESFFERAKPLFDYQSVRRQEVLDFDEAWDSDNVAGWESKGYSTAIAGNAPIASRHGEADQQQSNGVFCLACNKTFPKQTVYDGHLKGKKHIKAAVALAAKGISEDDPEALEKVHASKVKELRDNDKPIALCERLITRYAQILGTEREDTKAHVERKQALTDKERMEDAEEAPVEIAESDDDEEEEKVYNPLKLPTGWDGKPIPYWLYKLHGLGVSYRCDICGGVEYKGRKAFDRHFQEWRHAHGMRSLGLPNSKHFHDITTMQDAYALAEKLKMVAKQEAVNPDVTEELEDDAGNVYSRKTYEDLKRQGLI